MKKDTISERTYMVTLIDEKIRPKTVYEKVTQVAKDWSFPLFLVALLLLLSTQLGVT